MRETGGAVLRKAGQSQAYIRSAHAPQELAIAAACHDPGPAHKSAHARPQRVRPFGPVAGDPLGTEQGDSNLTLTGPFFQGVSTAPSSFEIGMMGQSSPLPRINRQGIKQAIKEVNRQERSNYSIGHCVMKVSKHAPQPASAGVEMPPLAPCRVAAAPHLCYFRNSLKSASPGG